MMQGSTRFWTMLASASLRNGEAPDEERPVGGECARYSLTTISTEFWIRPTMSATDPSLGGTDRIVAL